MDENEDNEVEPIEVAEDIYMVDTKMMGHDKHAASFILDAEKKAIVETGLSEGVDRIFTGLKKLGIDKEEVEYIAPTHVHMDHAGGAGFLAKECKNASVVCHENGVDYLSDPEKVDMLVKSVHRAVGGMADAYGTIKPTPRKRFEVVSGGETIDLGDHELKVIHASGHAPHQTCFLETKTRSLFTADEAGMYLSGVLNPTTPPPNFSLEKNLRSLEKLKNLDAERVIYTHFGSREDVENALDEYAETLEKWVEEVEDEFDEHGDKDKVIEEFTERDHLYYDIWDEVSARETLRMDVEGVLLYLKNKES